MRQLLLALVVALPAAPADPADGSAGGLDRSASVPAYQLHRDHHYLDDGVWVPRVFSRDDGYFQRGGGVSTASGRAVYDYDRDYPYDFPRGWGGRADNGYSDRAMADEPECRVERVPDRKSGTAEVRICS